MVFFKKPMFFTVRLFLKSFRRLTRRLALTLVLISGLGTVPATAQITPNGLGTQLNRNGNTFHIQGGTQAGRNLFHSFQQFGLHQGQIANFWSNPAIANILARVNGGSASYINGLIQVLGGRSNLFLMNPAGIVFGANASLNVPAAFTATTADRILFPGGSFYAYGENHFANLAGDPIGFAFDRKDPAAIVNEANLTATSVGLVAGQVINTGKVTANQITIAAVPGENLVRLSQAGQILALEFNPQQAAAVADASGTIPITRLPELLTGGGVTTVTANPDQTVTLAGVAVPMSSGSALIGGVLDASSSGANGGQVGVFGTNISLVNAEIHASGLTGGGEILIGGEFQGKGTQPNALNTWVNSGSILRADAVQVGNGGRIIVWADGTTKFAGSISAKGGELGGDGGFAEVSGKEHLLMTGFADLSATKGRFGTLLLDPGSVTIQDGENLFISQDKFNDDYIVTQLGKANLTIATSASSSISSETITVNGDVNITWSAPTTFTLKAGQNIVINSGAVIENTNASTGFDAIVFQANTAGKTSGNFIGIEINGAKIQTAGGNIKLTGRGGDTGEGNVGIFQFNGAQVSSTNGSIAYEGTGGNGTDSNAGVFLLGENTKITSTDGVISIIGKGGGNGTGNGNLGIAQSTGAQVSSTNGSITYDGTGGNGTDRNTGVALEGENTKIFTTGIGAISITGKGGGNGTGNDNFGIVQSTAAQVSSTNGSITYDGTGGNGTDRNTGVFLEGKNTKIFTTGSISINGRGGGTRVFNQGIVQGTGVQVKTESGNITYQGIGGNGTDFNLGVSLLDTQIISNSGAISILGIGQGIGTANVGILSNAFVSTNSGTIIYQGTGAGSAPGVLRISEFGSTFVSNGEDKNNLLAFIGNTITLSDVTDKSTKVLRTELDVATEEGIFSLDVAFGAEFANYLGVQAANTLRSAADVQTLLQNIYKQTGRKTAIVYWVLDQINLSIVMLTPGIPQGIAQNQGVVVASVDLATGLVQQPKTASLIYRGVPSARRDEVLRVISRFRNQLSDRRLVGRKEYLQDAQTLYRWLIEPIEPELQAQGIDTLLVVPDRGIRLLPLAALHDGKQFLIEKYNLAITPSINLISTQYRPLQGAQVLAMGASTFTNESPLPSVPTELKTITSVWPGRYFLNQDFTPERLIQERKSGQFRMVHLATHATFKPGDLRDSYIVFGNNQNLPVTQLPQLSLQGVELLTLAACRTLIGDIIDPTVEFGFAGLAVKTGVQTAVASLWNVDDTSTLALMAEFYTNLQSTPIKAEALRQAQLALLRGQTKVEGGQLRLVTQRQSIPLPPELAQVKGLDFAHPYFWSGFSMIGSPW